MTSTSPADNRHLWQLTDSHAIYETRGIRVRVIPTEPHLGATLDSARSLRSAPIDSSATSEPRNPLGRLFRLALPWGSDAEPISESYVRQQDLVITYQQQPPRTVRPQIYWRGLMHQPADCPGLEYVLSMQTDQLASSPECLITSELPSGAQVLRASQSAATGSSWVPLSECTEEKETVEVHFTPETGRPSVLFRPDGSEWSYLEMLYPGDFTEGRLCRVSETGEVQIRWRLFAESLEKGVIRRARLRGLILPRSDDEEIAERLWTEFLNSELPLTT